MNDPFGAAIHDYFHHKSAPDLMVNTNYTEDENVPVSWFFRKENEMPVIEKAALDLCRGKVLDIGAAAGCHSLELQARKIDVTAIERSMLAVEVMRQRGVNKVIHNDIFLHTKDKYDTLLLLMNGAGIGGTVSGLKMLFKHLKSLLNEKGQILIDSSDIKYLFEENDGSFWIDLNNTNYYGEMQYEVSYKKHNSKFDWLFIDFDKLKEVAIATGFSCRMVKQGPHFDYLAQLQPI